MNTLNTPAPWKVTDGGWDQKKIRGYGGGVIATVSAYHPDRLEADARLIAEAPALLAACEEVLSYLRIHEQHQYEDGQALMEDLERVIAQAGGQIDE